MWNNKDLVDNVDVMATTPIEGLDFSQQLSYGDEKPDKWISDLIDNNSFVKGATLATESVVNQSSTNIEQGGSTMTTIQGNEGFVPTVYKDTEGYDTIGYGHKLTEDDKKTGRYSNGVSQEEAQKLYEQDEQLHTAGLYKNAPWAKNQPQEVQEVLKDMAYNMGPGFIKEWSVFARQLREGKYQEAAENIKNSKYASQTKGRAIRNAEKLASL